MRQTHEAFAFVKECKQCKTLKAKSDFQSDKIGIFLRRKNVCRACASKTVEVRVMERDQSASNPVDADLYRLD